MDRLLTMMTPLIGISVPRSPEKSAFGVKDSVLQVLEYSDAIVAAGGRPVMLPSTEQIPDDLLAGIDGLVLSGGGDLSPKANCLYMCLFFHSFQFAILDFNQESAV